MYEVFGQAPVSDLHIGGSEPQCRLQIKDSADPSGAVMLGWPMGAVPHRGKVARHWTPASISSRMLAAQEEEPNLRKSPTLMQQFCSVQGSPQWGLG